MDAEKRQQVETWLHDGETERAEPEVTRALRKDPQDADALVFRARLTAYKGELGPAMMVLERVLKAKPDHSAALTFKSAVLVEQGKVDVAIPLLESVVKKKDAPPPAHYNLGRCYASKGDLDKAKQHFARAVAADPKNGVFHFAFGELCAELGDVEAALGSLVLSLQANPHLIEAWLVIARLQLQGGAAEDALRNLDEALEHNPGNPTLREQRASAYLIVGMYDAAVDSFAKLAEEFPEDTETLANLALSFAANEQYAESEGVYREALKLEPDNIHLYTQLAGLLELHESPDAAREAVKLLEKAIKIDRSAWEPLNDLGRLLVTRDDVLDVEGGAHFLERAIKLSKGAPEPLMNLAIAHARHGEADEARALCEKVRAHANASEELKEQAASLAAEVG
jgi:tetratricopeptide (TPR) repeat protein